MEFPSLNFSKFPNMTSNNMTSLVPEDDVIFSNISKSCDQCEDRSLVITRKVCEVWLSFPIAVFGIVTNILALIVWNLQRRQLTTTLVLKALAVADTLVLLTTILLRSLRYTDWEAYNSVYHHVFRWFYPSTYWVRSVDTWITVLLTVDRYIAVCHPLHAQRLCTRRRTYLSVFLILFCSLIFCLPRYFEYELVDDEVTEFKFQLMPHATSTWYTMVYRIGLFFIFMYLLPVSLLVALNIKLLQTLNNNKLYRSISLQHQTSTTSAVSYGAAESLSASSRSITATVVAVVIVFVICNLTAMTSHLLWGLHVCFKSLQYLDYPRRYLANISNVLVTLNSAVNFIIYCLCSRNFRVTLSRLLLCKAPPCPLCFCCACCCQKTSAWQRDQSGRRRISGYNGTSYSMSASTRLSVTSSPVYRYGEESSKPRLSLDSIKLHQINSNLATPT